MHSTKMSLRAIAVLFIAISTLGLSACNNTSQSLPTASALSVPIAPGAATRDLSQPALRSYRMHMVYTYESNTTGSTGKRGGLELTQDIILATQDQHVTSKSNGTATSAPSTSYETFLVDGISYKFNPSDTSDQKCVRYSSRQPDYSNPLLFKPTEIFASLKSPKLVKQGDDVDGVKADQYAVTEKDFTEGLFTSAVGSIWVAQDGGYVVKYAVEGVGPSMFSASSALDKIAWDYKLSDINQVATISLPTECTSAGAADDIPAPDDAANKTNEGPLFAYDTTLVPAKVGDFYRTALMQLGWSESSSTLDTLYTFTKAGRTLSIFISKQGKGYHVMVTDTNVR